MPCYTYIVGSRAHRKAKSNRQKKGLGPLQETTAFSLQSNNPCEKKASFFAASAQLSSCRKASQKLRKSRWYWHLRKSRLLRRAAEKPAFTKLLCNSAEKLQKSQLFYSFYTELRKIVMMSKTRGNAAITQVPIRPAFAKLLRRPA